MTPSSPKNITLLLLFSLFFSSNAQIIRVPLKNGGLDKQYTKLILITNLYYLKDNTIANPIDLASSKPTDPFETRQISVPTSHDSVLPPNKQWVYGYVFNQNNQNEFHKNFTLILVALQPGNDFVPMFIWVDKNNNLNLTDDGEPSKIKLGEVAEIPLDNRPNGYRITLEKVPNPYAGNNANFFHTLYQSNDKFLDTFSKTCQYRKYLPSRYSLRERRLNLSSGFWSNGRDSFLIGFKDNNYNGQYSDAEIDAIMMGKPGQALDNLQAITLNKKSSAYFEWNNAAYTIQKTDKDGAWVELLRDTNATLKYTLNIGDKIPRFRHCMSAKKPYRRSIRRTKGKTTYVYIWRPGLPDFERDSADLRKLCALQNENFQILGLNFGSSGKYVFNYNRRNGTNLIHGFSSNKINRKLKVKTVPTGFLIDKRQRIIAVNITPTEAILRLQKQ